MSMRKLNLLELSRYIVLNQVKAGMVKQAGVAKACLSGHYTLEQVGIYFGCSYATVSRAVKVYESQM